MTETTETQATAKPQPEGDKRNIPEEIHRLASALSRELMRVADKPKRGRNSQRVTMNAQLLSQTRFGNFIGLLLLAAFALACGGSPSASEDKKDVTQEPSSSQLSFGEYLAVCAGPASGAIDEEITLSIPDDFWKGFAAAVGEFTERLESVEPPEEVTDWHNAVLVYQRALKMELDDGPGEGESEEEYLFSTFLTLALEHQPEISAFHNGHERGNPSSHD